MTVLAEGPARDPSGAAVVASATDAVAPIDSSAGAATAPLVVPAIPVASSTTPVKPFSSDALATAALALFSVSVAAGFARVFAGWDFFDNLLVLVVVGHGIGLVARRLRLPAWMTIPLIALTLFWVIGLMFYASTYSWGFPSGDTWALFRDEIDLVREQFHVAVAPVLDGGGWPVLAAIGMAFAVCLSDAFAFGALARAEALVPGGVLFVFIAALGADRLRVELSMALVAAGVVATVVLRAHHAAGGIRAGRPFRRVVWQAATTAVVVGLLAGYVGQRLPGARAEALFDTRGNGDGSGAELSPLVDIRTRLTNQKAVELIVVTTNAESYWRSITLPEFDGQTWKSADRDIDEPAIDLVAARSTAQEVTQHLRIVGLAGELVPVAPDPTRASGPDGAFVPYDAGTSTLTAAEEFSNGDEFDLVSASPRLDPATLAAATSTDAGDRIYVELPDDFPDTVAQKAREVTAAASTPYDKALALQNWFRSEFDYSLTVQSGHGNSAIEGFLRDRVGYCEQFAGTYAAMMRSLGIPARVAVGFTPGDPRGGGSYSVAGRNAHAWPEVWFDGIGWVLFEPTPGRGAPGAESYTFVDEQQAPATDSPLPADSDAAPGVAPSTTAPIISDGAGPVVDEGPTEPAPLEPEATPEEESWPYGKWIVLVLAIAAAAPLLVRRIRRRAVGRTNDEKLALLWARSQRALHDVDVRLIRSETPNEFATRAAIAFPVVSRPIKSLAEVLTEATYRPEGSAGFDVPGAYGSSRIRDGAHWTRQIERAVTDSIGTASRVRRYFTRWR